MTTWTVSGSGYKNFEGRDLIDVIDFNTSGLTMADIDSAHVGSRLVLRGSANVDNLYIELTGSAGFDARGFTFGSDWSSSQDTLTFNETFSVSPRGNTTTGSSWSDRFFMQGGADSVNGGGGTDTLVLYYVNRDQSFSSVGAGHIKGNAGTSVRFTDVERLEIIMGEGNDRIVGIDGSDEMTGGGGNDSLDGARGHDDLNGGRGDDLLRGGAGRDTLDGGYGNDSLEGGTGDDTLMGATGDDVLDGGGGNDVLYAGTDTFREGGFVGSSEADRLSGGTGKDILVGGTDDIGDDFVFLTKADSRAGAGRDVIRHFSAGSDDIDLQAIDARPGTGFNDAFAYSGQRASAHSVWWVDKGADISVRADVTGDGRFDVEILLKGVSSLSVNDFLL